MKQRIITALILIPLAIGWMFFLPLDYFCLGAIVIVLLASREWGRFVLPAQPHWLLLPMGALLSLSLWLNPPAQLLLASPHPVILGILYAGGLWWLAALVMVLAYPRGTRWWRKQPWLKALFGVLTLLPFFWSLLLLRSHGYTQDPQLGGWVVFFVMLLFLHKIRCTLIPAIVAPVALLGTFTVMLLSGFSINILTISVKLNFISRAEVRFVP